MAPTLAASYAVYSAGNDTSTLTTASFTPANGEVIVVKMATWDKGITMGTPTGGSQTYTKRCEAAPGAGFFGYNAVWTAVISGSPGSMTISSTPSASCRHSMIVERWTSAQLAASPAVNSVVSGSGAPAADIVTAAANSVVSWASTDVNSVDPGTPAYRLSATEDGRYDGHLGSNSVHYFAYASVGAAGTYTMGMTAPTGQAWTLAGVEVQAAASTVNGSASLSGSGTMTASGVATAYGSETLTGTGTLTATGTATGYGAASLGATGTMTAAGTATAYGTVALSASGRLAVAPPSIDVHTVTIGPAERGWAIGAAGRSWAIGPAEV